MPLVLVAVAVAGIAAWLGRRRNQGKALRPRLWRRLSSRWRLNLGVLAVVVVIFVISAGVVEGILEDRALARIDDELHEAAGGSAVAVDLIGLDRLVELTEQTTLADPDGATLLLDEDGVVGSTASGPIDDPDPLPDVADLGITELRSRAGEPFRVGNVEGGSPDYRAMTVVLDDGLVLVIASSLQPVEDEEEAVTGAMLVVALAISLALMVSVTWISRRSLRPLETMIGTAQTIGSGQLDARLDLGDLDGPNPDVARLAGALNAMLERLQHAFADKEESEERLRRFVADASHELRTPLAAIIGYAELYHQGMGRSSEQIDHAMERITVEGERMRSLVEELLLLARLDQGAPVERSPVDVGDLVREAVRRAEAVDPERQIELHVIPRGLEVQGHRGDLARVLDNLLANALVHTEPGTPVRVAARRRSGRVVVDVADEGPGLSPEDASRAFDRFYRAEPSRARPGGSGLGLAIVQAVVEAHEGTVELDTAPGEGATFTVELPAD